MLRILLIINAAMFVAEMIVGILADSTGVLADSLDMLADALVYSVGLYAVGKADAAKVMAARLSGFLQITIALAMLTDILRRVFTGSEPVSWLMVAVSMAALVANMTCLRLISRHRDGGVHMRASWLFSHNDVLANLGVISAAVLVTLTGSRWPDLAIGLLITIIVLRGGFSILKDAKAESAKTSH
ncbi:cation transporter [Prosthecobacter sp.]|uniref:cation transporter n=1 Tax=Prosthecobacter sp. TaxID=1965333 RepID=UPI0025FF50B9|nr:cation transporter [Prosthecobacter sp.]